MAKLIKQTIFDDSHRRIWLGQYFVDYQFFCYEHLAHKPPIMILGNHFQNFSSLRKDVQILMEEFPVLIINLPGQGDNEQLVPHLSNDDLSDILYEFISMFEIEKVTPVAASFSVGIGFQFALKYPYKVHKLILGSATTELRPSARLLIEESVQSLKKNQMQKFASSIVLNFMNYSRREDMEGADQFSKALYQKMLNLTENEKIRFEHNATRFIHQRIGFETPYVETMVLAGQFDNLTTPYESFQMAGRFEFSNLLIIKDTDHLMGYEKKEVVNDYFIQFCKNQELKGHPDVELFTESHFPDKKKQLDKRIDTNEAAFLHSVSGGCLPVIVDNLNPHGFKLRTSFYEDDIFANQKWNLKFANRDINYGVLLFDYGAEFLRGMFYKCCFAANEKMERALLELEKAEEFP